MTRLFKIHCSQIGKIMSRSKTKGELSQTCQTFLKEWYANDREQIHSKYLDKGNWVESDLIDFMAEQLGYGMAVKNEDTRSDDYMVGTCDVELPDVIVDVKAPWNVKTLQDNCCNMDEDYQYQLRGYMRLWDKPEAILFYGLMNTPAEANYDREITYDHLPDSDRWIAYKITRDLEIEQAIIDRVKLCRGWLEEYDQTIISRMGRVHTI